MYKILIVEDENDLRENLCEIISGAGYSVFTADNGLIGLELAKRELPDLIMSDIRMPKMDGFEMLRQLQNDPNTSSIPLIYLTAKTEMHDLREAMNMGADDYIIKPFKIDDLLNAVKLRISKKSGILEKIESVKTNIFRKVPHELRTPLVSILGFSKLLEDDFDSFSSEELKEMARNIRISGYRLHKRVEKFLTYAELIECDKREYSLTDEQYEINNDYLFTQLYRLASEFMRTDDLHCQFDNALIQISEKYYIRILEELIENSFKFSKNGKPVVITGSIDYPFYKTIIIDQGKGIPAIVKNQIGIFNQFGDDKENIPGNGLGLTIASNIIQLTKGYLKIENPENRYTKIEFGIPLKKTIFN